ncbi:MAG: antibiotic biosynthesis monooxygenase [Saprospiraceae bacterium]|nr:antibiotic biosynthesis monooxygenase [Bacteroidia bacterium]NNE13733.1 antibiotic biosynthesis monooxygenase [Saprospiraceae bacterium]NNL91807.1 antibiotic biosynthesis monooxygenase [Saprospiraceae bacterium]
MIVRIVTMEFKRENIEAFKKVFEEKKERIRSFSGCQYLELLQGTDARNNIFTTYSHWQSEEDLNNYRYSDLFKETWTETKALFSKKAVATSFTKLHTLG